MVRKLGHDNPILYSGDQNPRGRFNVPSQSFSGFLYVYHTPHALPRSRQLCSKYAHTAPIDCNYVG